ncbi:MAG: nuclear transport factor 2 family protein [Pseudomonadota bacterium]
MNDVHETIETVAIYRLLARYTLAIDARDPVAWAACFTEDGAFVSGDLQLRGRAKLRAYAEVHARLGTRHVTSSPLYAVAEDGLVATGQATTVVFAASPKGYVTIFAGLYEDLLVKIDGTWLIQRRVTTPTTIPDRPDLMVHVADPDVAELVQPLLDAWNRLGEPA